MIVLHHAARAQQLALSNVSRSFCSRPILRSLVAPEKNSTLPCAATLALAASGGMGLALFCDQSEHSRLLQGVELQRPGMRQVLSSKLSFLSFLAPAKNVVVICGPSGVGKGTLVNQILAEYPENFGFSVSHTTRKPRPGEVNGKHYHFVGKEQMKAEIDAGKFIEHAEVHGNFYGTSIKAVKDVTQAGKVCVLDIDVQGAEQVKNSELKGKSVFVFIAPPSMEELESRLRGRGTESEEKIKTRLKNANGELAYLSKKGFWTEVFVNDDLEKTYTTLKDFLQRACRL